MILRVKNWAQFQHYKQRKPPWIKLHRDLLDDMTWHSLPLASRALAPMLWLLASETQEGKIEGDSESLAFRLRIASTALADALNPLIAAGWFIESDPASILLAPCLQHACSESETETESETEGDASAALARGNGAPPLAKKKPEPPPQDKWLKRLAEYDPHNVGKTWSSKWGPRPDAVGNGHIIPPDLLMAWRAAKH